MNTFFRLIFTATIVTAVVLVLKNVFFGECEKSCLNLEKIRANGA